MKQQLSILSATLIVLFILVPSIAGATTYYGTHLTTTFPWMSQITLFNNGDESISFEITVNNNTGTEVWKAEYDIAAYNAFDLFGSDDSTLTLKESMAILPAEEGTFQIETASAAVIPRLAYWYEGDLSLCTTFLSDTMANEYAVANTKAATFNALGMAVMNPNTASLTIRLAAYKDGVLVGDNSVSIEPHTKYVNSSDAIWSGLSHEEIDLITVSSQTDTFPAPIALVGDVTAGFFMFLPVTQVGKESPATASASYPVLDTGQTACYDGDGNEISCPESGQAFTGQDAQHTGNQFSYTDNGDGTITDNVTGLTWQQTLNAQGLSWEEAAAYCESLELGGHDDWRIPTVKELFSISNFSQGWPYLDTTYFDMAGATVSKDEQYWAEYYVGTTAEGGSTAAFGVNIGTGHIKAYPAGVSGPMGNYVRAVRGNAYGVNKFKNNGDGTVTDHATGLMWQQADSGRGMDWEEALAFAESAETASYDDWRLPNIKELQSIVDYRHSPSAGDATDIGPAIDTKFFNITELASGTTNYSPDYGYYWTSTSAYFNPATPGYYYAWYVAFGTAVNGDGADMHGAGAVRFDTKYEGGELGEGGERYYNFVRLVRDSNN